MAPLRSSNLERGKWRSMCREQLSKHIKSTVGISIEPSQVRLIPSRDDPYRWKVLPEKEYLFTKNMSDHSIGAYKELCDGIGVLFEAIPATNSRTGISSEAVVQEVFISAEAPQVSFSARIEELLNKNIRIEQELKHWRDQAAAELELRQRLEHELTQLKGSNQTLQWELQKSTAAANHFRDNVSQYAGVVNGIMDIVNKFQTGIAFDEGSPELVPMLDPQRST